MIRGLMHQIGSQEESYLASFATLSLVAKLIDPQQNHYAEDFVKVLENLEPEFLRSMSLDSHVCNQAGSKQNYALFLAHTYVNAVNRKRPHKQVSIRDVLQRQSLEEYDKWINVNSGKQISFILNRESLRPSVRNSYDLLSIPHPKPKTELEKLKIAARLSYTS